MNDSWKQLIEELIASGALKTPRIIAAFEAIDRKNFVLPGYESEAYRNYPLPVGEGQTISQPLTVAFMLELLNPQPGEKVLDIGHGSGWQAALLAHMVSKEIQNFGKIIAIERIPKLCEFGRGNIEKYGFRTTGVVRTICGDATEGVSDEAPFDKIIAAAALHGQTIGAFAALKNLPDAWRDQLKIGGVMVAPIGRSIWRFTKRNNTEWGEEEFPGFAFVPLIADNRQPATNNKPQRGSNKQKIDNNLQSTIYKLRFLTPLILFAVVILLSFFSYALFAPLELPPKTTSVEIKKGAGVEEIAVLLEEKHLIRSRWLFLLWALASRDAQRMQEGSYQFSGNIGIPALMRRLAAGELSQNERAITVPEGWGIDDIGTYLEKQNIVTKTEFFKSVGVPRSFANQTASAQKLRERFSFLQELPVGANFEGYFFPDTYRIFRDASAEEIATKMLANFERKIGLDLREEIHRQKRTLLEVITAASLVEREIPNEADRAVVSGILWKRLAIGMGLQVDATIIYITGKRSTKISSEELGIDSPYNTYKYRGLPLGPIANPGLSAIRAAVFPKPSPYLYYLSSPDGKTIFSKTLEEHNEAKAKYLK